MPAATPDALPIIQTKGGFKAGHQRLIKRIRQEVEAGKAQVTCYRGVGIYGSEAFYTFADGTVLHGVNTTADDGCDYSYLELVLKKPAIRPERRQLAGVLP